MSAYEMALKYYPLLWDERRIKALYEAGKLTEKEYKAVLNKGDE